MDYFPEIPRLARQIHDRQGCPFTSHGRQELPDKATLKTRYFDKLDRQEPELENLQASIKQPQTTEEQQRKEYESYLTALTVE